MRYFRDTRAEIAKVSWPTREEGIRLTLIVLTVTVVSGIFLWLIDVTFSFVIAWILQAMG
jgi:preprotein translocase subunit SecE